MITHILLRPRQHKAYPVLASQVEQCSICSHCLLCCGVHNAVPWSVFVHEMSKLPVHHSTLQRSSCHRITIHSGAAPRSCMTADHVHHISIALPAEYTPMKPTTYSVLCFAVVPFNQVAVSVSRIYTSAISQSCVWTSGHWHLVLEQKLRIILCMQLSSEYHSDICLGHL